MSRPRDHVEVAIVGLGSWGLCVLERMVHRARTTTTSVAVHVIEPGEPGGGVYNLHQPDYLVLNNPCGQLSLYASPDGEDAPPYAAGFFDWVVSRGYEWFGHECRTGGGGVPIQPGDYLPRKVMGEYLRWFYERLVASAPPNLTVVRHRVHAVNIAARAGGHERVDLSDGSAVEVDHVVLTSGHTYNEEPDPTSGVRYLRPYPVDFFTSAPAPGEAVALSGMGLVCLDLLMALTVGRGGSFEGTGARVRYRRSGAEPVIYLYSRSGLPQCAKSATGLDPTGDYQPAICTPAAFAAVAAAGTGAGADFRRDILPLLLAEMTVRYYGHAALLAEGASRGAAVRQELATAWHADRFDEAVDRLSPCYGRFEPSRHFFPERGLAFTSAKQYEQHVYETVTEDLDAALHPGGSPVKAALEVTRILRDDLRSVIEFGGLSLESYLDFQSNIRSRFNRIEAGPPPHRMAQLLALMDADVVRVPFGPSPALHRLDGGGVSIRSTRLEREESAEVSMVIRAHLEMPSLARSASPLLARLYRLGRLSQLRYGNTAVGSVAISGDFHPFDVEGREQSHISVLGVLTEGARYFTHYLPSPRSRLRAVLDAQACVESVIPR